MKRGWLACFVLLAAVWAHADDTEANAALKKGLELMQSGDPAEAVDEFKAAELYADTTSLKAGAQSELIKALNAAGLHYREFQAIEKMLDSYPGYADYPSLVAREYAIGDAFRDGYREPAFASLSWIPWLTGRDKSPEIYEQALKRAPYAEEAGMAKLELALHYLVQRDLAARNKGLNLLRELIAHYPNTKAAYLAYIELANALFQLSERGDGDGAFNREGIAVMEAFIAHYPDAPERGALEVMLQKSKDSQARTMLGNARFYVRMKRPLAAESYLSDILKTYPDSESASAAEKLLADLDGTYVPDPTVPMAVPERLQSYAVYSLPEGPKRLLVAPENSGGKWLLPIYDLNIPRRAGAEQESEAGK